MPDLSTALAEAGIRPRRWRQGESRAPCPRCDRGPRDDALAVRIGTDAAMWVCHRCGWSGRITDRDDGSRTPRPTPRPRPEPAQDDAARQERDRRFIRRVLSEAKPIEGTPAETYLRWRGCAVPSDPGRPVDPEALRFRPRIRHPASADAPEPIHVPALVMPITAATDARQVIGIHLIALTADGAGKSPLRPRKWTRGPCRGGVIRLVADADVTMGLGVAEGPETALAILAGGWSPVWATIAAGGMATMPVLPPVCLTIWADADPAGMEAARTLARRWREAGLTASVHASPVPADPNDGDG